MSIHQPDQPQNQADPSLTLFLKQHRPIAPPDSCDLEQKLMQQINCHSVNPTQNLNSRIGSNLIKIWVIPLIALCSGIAIWTISDRAKFQPSFADMNTEQKQQLEATLVKDWLISSGEDPEEVNTIYGKSETSN
jgi:hypothetical protein